MKDAWVHAALWWISWVADFSGKQLSHLKDEEDVTMLLVYLEPRNIQHISNRFAKARITHAQARIAHAHRNTCFHFLSENVGSLPKAISSRPCPDLTYSPPRSTRLGHGLYALMGHHSSTTPIPPSILFVERERNVETVQLKSSRLGDRSW